MTKYITFLFFLSFLSFASAQQPTTWKDLDSLSIAYMEAANYDTALVFAYKALAQAKVEFGERDTNYIQSLDIIGLIYYNKGIEDSIIVYCNKSVLLYKEIVGEKSLNYVVGLHNLAMLYQKQIKYKEAESLHLKSINIGKEILLTKNLSIYAKLLGGLATLYSIQDKYQEASPLFLEAINILEEIVGKKNSRYADALNGLGILYVKQGKYIEAEPLLLEVIQIRKEISSKKHTDYAQSLNNLAGLYQYQGKYIEAEPLLLESVNIIKELLSKNHSFYTISLRNLAASYYYQGKYIEMEALLLEAIQIDKEILSEKDPLYANDLHDLAMLYVAQGKYRQADSLFLVAIKIRQEQLGEKNPNYANSLNGLAESYKNQGKYKQADSLCLSALKIHKNALGIKHLDYINTLFRLAKLRFITNQCLSKDSIFTEALSLQQEILLENFSAMSERDRTNFLAKTKENCEYYHYFSQYCGKETPAIYGNVYNILLQQKGILLYSTQKMRTLVAESKDSVVNHLYIKWLDEKSYGNKMAQLTKDKREQMSINLLDIQHTADSFEKAICYKLPAFKEAITVPNGSWQEAQQQLKSHEAAVELVRFRTFNNIEATDTVYYGAYIITAQTKQQPIYVFLPNGNEMEKEWLTDYSKYIDIHGDSNKIQLKDSLSYTRYLKPILDACGDAKTIYFAADGVYHKLNLASLWTNKGRYVIQDYDIHTLASTRDLVKTKPESLRKRPLTAELFGNPAFDMSEDSLEKELKITSLAKQAKETINAPIYRAGREPLRPLAGAEIQVKEVANILQKNGFAVQASLKEKALEERVQMVKNPTILVFATHGGFEATNEKKKSENYNMADDDMYKSKLYFAGAKNTLDNADKALTLEEILAESKHEDGILYAAEAALLQLDSTELVVLSACETGLGTVQNGEGVFGLQRAFRIAGAKNLIMSLWKVEDKATKELMVAFFTNWIEKGMSKYEAFRQAQLTQMQIYPHEPKKWGGFILMESNPTR